ncbi:hypothetical protein GALLN_00020 [Gallionellaceae bacterium]|nr:hypothetical protein GALLN_00020 [Gallionellaceae bacterium]
MNLPAQLFPGELLWLTNIVFMVLLGRAIWFAPWRGLLNNGARVNALVGLSFGMFLFWQFSAGTRPGINHHMLGATLFVLMFGWRIALCLLTLMLLGTMLRLHMDLNAFGINGLVMVIIPVLFSELVLRLSQSYLPKNFFIFVLGNGFLCSALAMSLTISTAVVLLVIFSTYKWGFLQYSYLAAAPIIVYAEAFATGALITAFTVSKPEAVFNFDADAYFPDKPH